MTQPKTQAELQARVLEVLRREWPATYVDEFKIIHLFRGSDSRSYLQGMVSSSGEVRQMRDLTCSELDALAEASRLLRDGVAKPSRLDRALEVLREVFPGACIDRRPYTKGTEPPPPQLPLTLGLALRHVGGAYESHAWCVINTTLAQHRAIAKALEILNAPGSE